ncbi:MAG: N-acetyl-gamma-glutamyl-phosphate reductase [Pseudomonadota bacterium]
MAQAQAAILGASGYTGAETVRLLATHPEMRIAALTADRKAGQPMAAVFPHLRHLDLPTLTRIEDVDFTGIDIAFVCLPHGTTHQVVAGIPEHVKVVDLSAGFRLRDPAAYEAWYGAPHAAPELQATAVYGLTEFYREEICAARLVAGTGCNAATGQFALRPLIASGLIDLDEITIDLKAAASGAGRALKEHLLTAELYESVHPYSMGGKHRHLAEFDQEFSAAAGRKVEIQFSPHLIPASRGILVTASVRGDPRDIHGALAEAYAREPFLVVLPFGAVPAMKDVRGSNYCHIGVAGDRRPGRATIVAVLDNLTKGSSGQAVQNANLMLNLPETAGLQAAPLFP